VQRLKRKPIPRYVHFFLKIGFFCRLGQSWKIKLAQLYIFLSATSLWFFVGSFIKYGQPGSITVNRGQLRYTFGPTIHLVANINVKLISRKIVISTSGEDISYANKAKMSRDVENEWTLKKKSFLTIINRFLFYISAYLEIL